MQVDLCTEKPLLLYDALGIHKLRKTKSAVPIGRPKTHALNQNTLSSWCYARLKYVNARQQNRSNLRYTVIMLPKRCVTLLLHDG